MHRAAVLGAPHHVAEGEENAAEQHDSEKQSHQVPAFEHPIAASASAFPLPAIRSYFFSPRLHPLRNQIDRQRKNDRRVFLDADFGQRLQIAQLDRSGLLFQHFGGVRQLGGSFKFAFRVNNLSAALAFRFRLAGDGALHILRNIDLLDLNLRYLDTPRLGILVKDLLQFGVNLFALGENRSPVRTGRPGCAAWSARAAK